LLSSAIATPIIMAPKASGSTGNCPATASQPKDPRAPPQNGSIECLLCHVLSGNFCVASAVFAFVRMQGALINGHFQAVFCPDSEHGASDPGWMLLHSWIFDVFRLSSRKLTAPADWQATGLMVADWVPALPIDPCPFILVSISVTGEQAGWSRCERGRDKLSFIFLSL